MRWWLSIAIASRMFACVTVQSDRIRGADLAASDPRFGALDPGLDFGPAPLVGVQRVLREPELRRFAAAYGIEDAPSELCLERATQTLTAENLQPLLEAALNREPVEILDFSKYMVPQGTLEFTRAGLAASGFWRGRVSYGQNRYVTVWAKVRLTGSGGRVERGDTVRVEVRSGGVVLAFDAAAESSGRAGDAVIVKNPQNGRRFQARVEGKGKVSITK